MTTTVWSGIRERVAALHAHPDRDKVFGANGHGFVLEPVLGTAELAELEGQLGVALPDEYRGF